MDKIPMRNLDGTIKRSYRKWSGMMRRCYSERTHNYKWYGGRGITVAPEWHNYTQFVTDMGEPEPMMTLERIDNEQGYSKANCKWATMAEQCANRRPGGPQPNPDSLRQKALKAGLPYLVVYFRLNRLGWTEQKALTTPKAARS